MEYRRNGESEVELMVKNKLLLIEDEEKTGKMLRKALEYEGIEVVWAKDGRSALEQVKNGRFDLIILDLKLPDIHGDELLENLRSIAPYVRVIVYSVEMLAPVMKKLIEIGVDGYINKGVDTDLWEIVEKVKAKLAPFSTAERSRLLDALPKGIFCDNHLNEER